MMTVNEFVHTDMADLDLAECILSYLKDMEFAWSFKMTLAERMDIGDTISHAEELVRRMKEDEQASTD